MGHCPLTASPVSFAAMATVPSAILDVLKSHLNIDLAIRKYSEHSIGEGTTVKTTSYIALADPRNKAKGCSTAPGSWGVGVDSDIATSGLQTVLSAMNSAIGDHPLSIQCQV